MRLLYLIGGFLGISLSLGLAQSVDLTRVVRYSVELGGLAASDQQTPFWLRTNQYGTVPLQGSFGTLRMSVQRDYKPRADSTTKQKKRFDWGFGLYAVANAGPRPTADNPAVLLPDAYLKIRFGKLELYGGNRREVYGLGDTLLTSGFVAWSGNALPFPKIQLHTPDFVPLGFIKKLIALRVGYAHGWFANSYIKGSYLHQKYLYGRIGKPHWHVRLYLGLNHQVQWGGRADYLIGSPLAVDGNLASSFQDYLSMVSGRYPDAVQNDRFTGFDGENRIGNHVGSYDIALEWNGAKRNWLLYHQHIYDDASGLALQNIPDGLTGLRFLNHSKTRTRFRFQRIVLEWLNTMNQSGPVFDPLARFQGADNYFNHSQYIEGWSYRGRTVGTPFIAPRAGFAAAVNQFTGGGFFPNNRLVAWYTGISGGFRRGPLFTIRASISRNYGSYNQPYPQPFRQFSGAFQSQWPLDRKLSTTLITTFAIDRGDLFPNVAGGYLGLKKSW
ncbi:capsule assembly Wzi family protein [Spirosoma fluminis]